MKCSSTNLRSAPSTTIRPTDNTTHLQAEARLSFARANVFA